MTEAGAIYSALGRHTGAAGFRSPQQTLPNIPVSKDAAAALLESTRMHRQQTHVVNA